MDGILDFYTYKTTRILDIKHSYCTNVVKFNNKSSIFRPAYSIFSYTYLSGWLDRSSMSMCHGRLPRQPTVSSTQHRPVNDNIRFQNMNKQAFFPFLFSTDFIFLLYEIENEN